MLHAMIVVARVCQVLAEQYSLHAVSPNDGLSGADEVRGLGGDATDAKIRVTSSSHRKLFGETELSNATVGKPVAENAERIGGERSRCSSIQREVTAIEGPYGARDKSKYEVDAMAGGSVLPATGPRTVTCGDSSMVSLLVASHVIATNS